jgi:hypothetical protein
MLLAQVAMLLEADFLGNPGRRLGTRMFLPFLALVRSFLRKFQFGLLLGAEALDASSDVRSECMSIGIMPFSFMLHWFCHWIGHMHSTWLPSSASMNRIFLSLVLAFALGL